MSALGVFGKFLKWALVLLVVLFVLAMGGIFLIEIPFTLAFGWIRFLKENFAELTINGLYFAEAAVCIVLLGAGGHRAARWLYLQMAPGGAPPWRAGWTVAGLAGVLLLFVAGIATIGITHQTVWLFTTEGPLVEESDTGWRVSGVFIFVSDLKSAVTETFERTGRLPDNNEEAGVTWQIEPSNNVIAAFIDKGGVVKAMLAATVAEGGIITFTPAVKDGKIDWTCRSNVKNKYLPASCRDPLEP